MAQIERIGGYYEIQEVDFGLVYRWCPERFVVECDCGETLTTGGPEFVCACGADHAPAVEEKRAAWQAEDEALHPWRYAGEREGVGLPL